MPQMEAVVEEASIYEHSALGGSVMSPMNSSINTGSNSLIAKQMKKSVIFTFGEDINVESDDYESDEDGLEA